MATKKRLKGAQFDKRTGKWSTTVSVNGFKQQFGPFDTAKEAHEVYMVTTEFLKNSPELTTPAGGKRKRASAMHPVQPVPGLLGVLHDRNAERYEAVIELPRRDESGRPIRATGGQYDTAEEAARAYDALARMYYGEDAPTNYAADAYASFRPPTVEELPARLEVKRGVKLRPKEVADALRAERALDVRTYDVRAVVPGVSWLICCTGRNVTHMRRLADLVFSALVDRRLKAPKEVGEWGVEARTSDSWMLVDCGNLCVNVFSDVGRSVFEMDKKHASRLWDEQGEEPPPPMKFAEYVSDDEGGSPHVEGMPLGTEFGFSDIPDSPDEAIAQGASPEDARNDPMTRWVAANPVPEAWLDKIERDSQSLFEDDDDDDAPKRT